MRCAENPLFRFLSALLGHALALQLNDITSILGFKGLHWKAFHSAGGYVNMSVCAVNNTAIPS